MAERPDPVQPADAAACAQARNLLAGARFGALAFTDAETGTPGISRIALGLDEAGGPVTLISSLSAHHAALRQSPLAALMVGEPGPKGDPLTHPRLMIRVEAQFVDRADPGHTALRDQWLATHPKAKLYVDFGDFGFVRLVPLSAFLNGGFGRAVRLDPGDVLFPRA
jgi:putative heme iron utilization protein